MSTEKNNTLALLRKHIKDIGVNMEEISEIFRQSEEEWNAQRREELGLTDKDEYVNEY